MSEQTGTKVLHTHHPNYQSYLLRLWRDGAEAPWRSSLQCTATDQLFHFAAVEDMLAFLTTQLAAGAGPCDDPP